MINRREAITGVALLGAMTGDASASESAPADGIEPPRALTERGLTNLIAFARLYGDVRYFHPSDQAARADWDALALAGVQRVETARDSVELAAILKAVFTPVAPTLALLPAGAMAKLAPPPSGEGGQWISWRHEGIGIKTPSTYRSDRLPVEGVANGETVRVELGGGIAAVMPISVWRDDEARTHPTMSETPLPPRKPVGFRPSGEDRATRLADVVIAWNLFQHFYPYFDITPVDWTAELPRAFTAAATDPDGLAFSKTLMRLVAALRDGHGMLAWQDPKTPGGRAPVLFDIVESQLVVVQTGPGVSARIGDVVTTIDGRPVAEVFAERTALISTATPQWRDVMLARTLPGGPLDKPMVLGLRRADGTAATATLAREAGAAAPKLAETRPEPFATLKPGLLYVDLTRIEDAALEAAYPQLVAAKAIVVDMRGYPKGGARGLLQRLTDKAIQSAIWNVPIGSRPNRQGWTWRKTGRWRLDPLTPRVTGKAVFVTDGRAISYAESIMGIVEAYRLGEIVGGATAGTNGDVNPIDLPGGYRMFWTGTKVIKHDGSGHHGVGIAPTVPVSRTIAGVRAGRDELLERAIAVATA